MAALSKLYTVNTVYSQVDVRCHNIKDYKLDPQIELDAIRNRIMIHYGIANSAVQHSFRVSESLAVSSGVISLAGKNIFRMTGVGFGKNRPYIEANSQDHFYSVQRDEATQTNKNGRYWFLMQGQAAGDGELWIFQGSAITGESTLNVGYIRYPNIAWTLADIASSSTTMVDFPDWAIPHLILAAAADCLGIANVEVPKNLADQVEVATNALARDLTLNDATAKAQGKDSLNG